MGSKRGAISFILIITFVILSMSLIAAADYCSITTSCNSANRVMDLSGATNAHGERYDVGAYSSYLCCDFTTTNPHTCSASNKVLGLSYTTNAHAEIPSLSNYGYPICFGDFTSCYYTTSSSCNNVNDIEMVSLSSTTNAHIGGFNDYTYKICCTRNTPPPCGNGIKEGTEGCDDGGIVPGDGCSATCQIESGWICNNANPTCCYSSSTPVSHWYLNGNSLNAAPDYYGLRLNDVLTMKFDSAFCLASGTTRTIEIRKGTTVIGTSSATVTGSGTSGYTQGTFGPIQFPFLTISLGTGNSDIFFRIANPGSSTPAYYDSYTVRVIPKYCGDGTCEAGDGETCGNCPGDCKCPTDCPCPTLCGNNNIDYSEGEECDDGDTENNDGCSSTCQIEECGDNIKQTNEECDDGNLIDGDHCSSECETEEYCGDLIVQASLGEKCDGSVGGRKCSDELGGGATGTLSCWAPGTANECQYDTRNCVTSDCSITSAFWSKTEVNEGTWVSLNLQTSNCNNGEQITFVVKEDDGFLNSGDDVGNEPSPVTINGNTATGSWQAEWQDDTYGLSQENPPEYVFTATITSNNDNMKSSNLLIVNEVNAACSLINYCSDYKNYEDCTNDACTVADDSFPSDFCGASFNEETRCMDSTNCFCSWNENTQKCNPNWDKSAVCDCGNGIEDNGEQCDDGNDVSGDGCTPDCMFEDNIAPPCPYGTTLCLDGTCSKNCYDTDTSIATCTIDGSCNVGVEGCNCIECQGDQDTCAAGLICTIFNVACCNSASDDVCDPECSYVDPDCGPAVCGNGYREEGEQCDLGEKNGAGSGCLLDCTIEVLTPCCIEGTAECEDGTCSLNCYATDTLIIQNGDNCCTGLTFSPVDQACCNTAPDEYCNPYCHYVDPDCVSIPSPSIDTGVCMYTDATTDTCEDDGVLFRSLDALWNWAEENNYITKLNEDYIWDESCGTMGCYRYDPLNSLGTLRESEGCVSAQDVIACPPQIQINFFGIYSLLAAIVLIIIIYLIFFSKKKKKLLAKRKK